MVLGTVSLASVVGDFIDKLIDRYIPSIRRWFSKFHLHFTQDNEDVINLPFDTKDIAAFVLCGAIGIWYVLKKVILEKNCFAESNLFLPKPALVGQQFVWILVRHQSN